MSTARNLVITDISYGPSIAPALEALTLRLATENPRWGYRKIHGELLRLAYALERSTLRAVMK